MKSNTVHAAKSVERLMAAWLTSPDNREHVTILSRLVWHLLMRSEVGTITLRVEQSVDLKSWTPDGVEHHPGGGFSIPVDHRGGFLRLITER